VQGDKTGDEPLSEKVKNYIKNKYHKPGEVFLGVVHRIDRPVSGAVLFARTSKALARLNQILHDHEIHKIYWAVVKNKPPKDSERLTHYLRKDEAKNKSFALLREEKGYQKAELSYTVIGHSDNYYFLEIELHTGRHHQIRVQLAGIGCPIKGDLKYGFARSNPDASIHLHARSAEFIHPVKKELLKIVAPPPDEVLWKAFEQMAVNNNQ
jgi:23S rRNA pseudouridine1911/1915/1917 synthase